jgi:hypothetical protein
MSLSARSSVAIGIIALRSRHQHGSQGARGSRYTCTPFVCMDVRGDHAEAIIFRLGYASGQCLSPCSGVVFRQVWLKQWWARAGRYGVGLVLLVVGRTATMTMRTGKFVKKDVNHGPIFFIMTRAHDGGGSEMFRSLHVRHDAPDFNHG